MTLLYTSGGQFVKSNSKSQNGVMGNFGIIANQAHLPYRKICAFDTFWNTIFALYMSQYTAQGEVYCPTAVFSPSGVDNEPLSMWLPG